MKIFPRYVADPGLQSGIAEEMGIHQTTVSKTLSSVSKKIMEKADLWIKVPSSTHDITVAKNEWLQKFKFPSAIGVIGCTHVRIPKPVQFGDEYINRKGFVSINVQATCNVNEQFTRVEASWPGSVHDNGIWRNSSVWKVLSECKNTVLLGD
ncbi:putative nuclease HARBI1 [Schistocerca cancellata]|uniref:putative nuclease HARBI1 n=1 Tax=Schistocerca cancellata TaxID=274614 RepID=UPI002117CF0F|nr:putative nuclease HARBI1 [Schistocerca cancellata]